MHHWHRIKCECCRWALGGDYDVDSLHSSVAAAKRTWKICACRYGDAIHVCCAAAAHRHCTVTFKVMSILIKGCVRHTEQMQYLHKMHFAFNQFKCGFECIAFINELYIWLNRGRVCVDCGLLQHDICISFSMNLHQAFAWYHRNQQVFRSPCIKAEMQQRHIDIAFCPAKWIQKKNKQKLCDWLNSQYQSGWANKCGWVN